MQQHYGTVSMGYDVEPENQFARIYIWGAIEHGASQLLVFNEKGHVDAIKVPHGERPPRPSLTMPLAVLQAFRQGLLNKEPDAGGLENHLRDTVKVRDRLLTLVERLATEERPTPAPPRGATIEFGGNFGDPIGTVRP